MANLRRWSSSASGNSSVAGGANTINFAEGQAPGSVNNSAREMMAQIRSIYTPDEWGWVEHSATASVASQTAFKLAGNQTSAWTANRRWRLRSGSTTRYGTIVSSSFTTETTITVTVDSGSLSASHSLAALSPITVDNFPSGVIAAASTAAAGIAELATTTEVLTGTDADRAVTPDALAALWEQGANVASAGTISLGEGGYFVVTGTTTITDIDFATDKAGRVAWVQFSGALTLTHGANLILPGGANITTAAGDVACFVSEGSDVVRCTSYTRANGMPVVGMNWATPVTLTSQTSVDFTGIPAWATKIIVSLSGVSTNGSNPVVIQLGDSGGAESTGYDGQYSVVTSTVSTVALSSGFTVSFGASDTSSAVRHGLITLTKISGNTWVANGVVSLSNANASCLLAGSKTTSATLDRVTLAIIGAGSFDAGTVNVGWM